MTICSDIPEKTSRFYGREEELLQIRKSLDPSRPGRKAVFLFGIGGSGKTQLALQHIEQEKSQYSAVVWVNASSREHTDWSFSKAATTIATGWPRDLPLFHGGRGFDNVLYVTSRLRTTCHRKWLLVIDSADGPDYNLVNYIPACEFGSVLVTSTESRIFGGFKPDVSIHVDGLDKKNSLALLRDISQREDANEQGK